MSNQDDIEVQLYFGRDGRLHEREVCAKCGKSPYTIDNTTAFFPRIVLGHVCAYREEPKE